MVLAQKLFSEQTCRKNAALQSTWIVGSVHVWLVVYLNGCGFMLHGNFDIGGITIVLKGKSGTS